MRLHPSVGLTASAVAALLVAGGGTFVVTRSADSSATFAAVAAPPVTAASAAVPAASTPSSTAAAKRSAAPKRPAPKDRAKAESRARALVKNQPKAVLESKDDRYAARDVVLDADGAEHVRFDRTYRGLEVLGGDFVVHSTADGGPRFSTVAQTTPITGGITPTVSATTAVRTAKGAHTGTAGAATPTLVIDAADGTPVLAWRILVDGADKGGRPDPLNVIVDARDGRIRRTYGDIVTAGTGHGYQVGDVGLSTTRRADGTYQLIDPERGDGETRDLQQKDYPDAKKGAALVDADDVWGDGALTDRATLAADVHYGVAQTWDYYATTFGRKGIRNDGKGATAYVHAGVADANAGWGDYCFCMMFGDGDASYKAFTTIEIVGHEMTHGVVSATADLDYVGEAGGLNESTADIFGVLTEFHANNPVDPPDYLIGEGVLTGGRALRYMDRPIRDGWSPSCWSPTLKTFDVHDSSGVGNKFFYTLSVGSGKSVWGESPTCGGAPAVTGIGNDKAGRIWYRALTTYMVSTTDYAQARTATLLAATDLYGAGGTEYKAVDAAWEAVAVDGSARVPDHLPTTRKIADRFDTVGDAVSLQFTATDPDGQPLTLSAPTLPAGLSMNASGLITGVVTTPQHGPAVLTATDSDGNTVTARFTWDVLAPLTITGPEEQFDRLGEPVWAIVTTSAAEWEKPVFSATGLPAGVVVEPQGGYIYGKATQPGTTIAVLTVTTVHGRTKSVQVPWRIFGMPSAPPWIKAFGGSGSASIEWGKPDENSGGSLGYEITTIPGGKQTVWSGEYTTVSGLQAGRDYVVEVRANNLGGTGPPATITVIGTTSAFTVPTAMIDQGGSVTASGRLTRSVAGTDLGGVDVRLEQKLPGATAWTALALVRTGADGRWSRTVKPTVSASYRAIYPGGPALLGSISTARSVPVRYTVTAKASNAKPKAKKKIAITGVVKPSRAKSTVVLQRLVGKKWVKVASAKTTSKGAYTFSRSFTKGTWKLRVLASADKYNAEKASTTFTVTAK
jgi:Zn-dependent metalloprotease